MNFGVRILKHGRNDNLKSLPIREDEKTDRQSDREIVSTIKGWIAELEQRHRVEERRYSALIK